MLRPFAEVPGYLLTALTGIGLLLFGHFLYVLGRAAIPPMLLTHNYIGDTGIQSGSFSTQRGEYRCEGLPDESRVCLNTSSKVRFAISGRARNIEVVSGEVSFVVRKDRRPFDVACASLLVHDVSTAFDIYKKDGSAQVTVIEGRVRVLAPFSAEQRRKFDEGEATDAWKSAPEYYRLQQVEYDETTQTLHDRPALSEQDLVHRMAWQEGRIDLSVLSLGEALDEFSRYQPATRFEYADRSLTRLRVGGMLDAAHLPDFLDWLEKSQHIHHTMTMGPDGSTVITLSQNRRD